MCPANARWSEHMACSVRVSAVRRIVEKCCDTHIRSSYMRMCVHVHVCNDIASNSCVYAVTKAQAMTCTYVHIYACVS
jgi:hypothetical protein